MNYKSYEKTKAFILISGFLLCLGGCVNEDKHLVSNTCGVDCCYCSGLSNQPTYVNGSCGCVKHPYITNCSYVDNPQDHNKTYGNISVLGHIEQRPLYKVPYNIVLDIQNKTGKLMVCEEYANNHINYGGWYAEVIPIREVNDFVGLPCSNFYFKEGWAQEAWYTTCCVDEYCADYVSYFERTYNCDCSK